MSGDRMKKTRKGRPLVLDDGERSRTRYYSIRTVVCTQYGSHVSVSESVGD